MTSIVLIDGIDGSGKTRFAARLCQQLQRTGPVLLLHVDDCRRAVDWGDPRGEAAVYWDDYFDLAGLDSQLAALTDAAGTVLVEGIFTLRLAAAATAPLVYLDADFAEAGRRILGRDVRKGRTPEDVRHRIAQRYFPAQEKYRSLFQPESRASLLIDNGTAGIPRLVRADWSRFSDPLCAALKELLACP